MISNLPSIIDQLLAGDTATLPANVYQPSIQVTNGNVYFIWQAADKRSLVVYEDAEPAAEFSGEQQAYGDKMIVIAPLTAANNAALAKRFAWIKPSSRHGHKYTFGLGDRLGNASNAHLRLFKGRGIFPVLAQQSIRELLLTGRTEQDVVLAASWAVFEEGYQDGWGADGDHVKEPFEVEYALESGCSMITLDATKQIHNEIAELSDAALDARYQALDPAVQADFNATYLDKTFELGQASVHFDRHELEQSVLIFFDAVRFAADIYARFIKPGNVDFEISMDETIVPTTPANHYFFANELARRGITPETMAPKFYGEFQKAIDYQGNIKRFEREFVVHEAIAEHFGYRLSIHSGSDKLSVYPIIGKLAKNHGWHVKTAGTNWLEACRVIAKVDPSFLRAIYQYAYDHLQDVKSFYVFQAEQSNSPRPETIKDVTVMRLVNEDNPRQILHTMYGSILNAQASYHYVFRDRFFAELTAHQALYDDYLNRHIAEHLDLLQNIAPDKAAVKAKYDPE